MSLKTRLTLLILWAILDNVAQSPYSRRICNLLERYVFKGDLTVDDNFDNYIGELTEDLEKNTWLS